MGELSLSAYHRQYGVGAASCRISTAYGPRENETHAIIALIAKAYIQQEPFEIWGDGTQTRGFTYVQDVVEGLMKASEHITDGRAINVGADEFISLNDVARFIFECFGWQPANGIRYLRSKPVGVLHRALDLTLAEKLCNWRPRVSFEDGLQRTIEWYRNEKDISQVTEQLDYLLNQRKSEPTFDRVVEPA
jgi:UDP-glucose 4-epimerase